METLPITARSFEKDYHIDCDEFGRAYKDHISGFRTWEELDHADEWLIFPENVGPHVSIDETCLSAGEVYTIISNKDAHGRKGCIIAIVKGTKAKDVIKALKKIDESQRKSVVEVTLDFSESMFSLTHSLRMIFSQRCTKEQGEESLRSWYLKVGEFGNKAFNDIAAAMYDREDEILNYFVNRSSNASAESLNAKNLCLIHTFLRVTHKFSINNMFHILVCQSFYLLPYSICVLTYTFQLS